MIDLSSPRWWTERRKNICHSPARIRTSPQEATTDGAQSTLFQPFFYVIFVKRLHNFNFLPSKTAIFAIWKWNGTNGRTSCRDHIWKNWTNGPTDSISIWFSWSNDSIININGSHFNDRCFGSYLHFILNGFQSNLWIIINEGYLGTLRAIISSVLKNKEKTKQKKNKRTKEDWWNKSVTTKS